MKSQFVRLISHFCLLTCTLTFAVQSQQLDHRASQQLIVVTTDNWSSQIGQLTTFSKVDGQWQQESIESPVTVGRNGLAWGIGLHVPQQGLQKQEGDGRAPAGLFALTGAFGYDPLELINFGYQQMQASHFCVDVPASPLYNQTVDAQVVGKEAVKGSSEGMRRDIHNQDQLYRRGVFVAHNPNNIADQGSCIFLHQWRGPGMSTAGCTAMPAHIIDEVVHWLDKDLQPRMVILPKQAYRKRQAQWDLPILPN